MSADIPESGQTTLHGDSRSRRICSGVRSPGSERGTLLQAIAVNAATSPIFGEVSPGRPTTKRMPHPA
jgi:hypothetical protein